MPLQLRISVFLLALAALAHGIVAPLYETGFARISTPLIDVGLIVLLVLFSRRVQWTWHWVQACALAFAMISAVFYPTPELYGRYTVPSLAVAGVEVIAGVTIFLAMRKEQSKRWFASKNEG